MTDDRLWSLVDEQCAGLSEDDWREINRADRRAYDALRSDRPSGKSGRRLNDRARGGHFVAIDSEGVTLKHTKTSKKVKGKIETIEKFDQRTCLWMAGGADGYENAYIEEKTGVGFTSEQIFELLLSLPKQYAAREVSGKQPIFVSFGFSRAPPVGSGGTTSRRCGRRIRLTAVPMFLLCSHGKPLEA